jgi:hypothetical protein
MFWTLGKGFVMRLIKCTLGSGKPMEGLGIWRGGYEGAMGDKREQFTSNLGLRWTIPITTGGCQVSRKRGLARGVVAKGTVHMYIYVETVLMYICQNDRSDE